MAVVFDLHSSNCCSRSKKACSKVLLNDFPLIFLFLHLLLVINSPIRRKSRFYFTDELIFLKNSKILPSKCFEIASSDFLLLLLFSIVLVPTTLCKRQNLVTFNIIYYIIYLYSNTSKPPT